MLGGETRDLWKGFSENYLQKRCFQAAWLWMNELLDCEPNFEWFWNSRCKSLGTEGVGEMGLEAMKPAKHLPYFF